MNPWHARWKVHGLVSNSYGSRGQHLNVLPVLALHSQQ